MIELMGVQAQHFFWVRGSRLYIAMNSQRMRAVASCTPFLVSKIANPEM